MDIVNSYNELVINCVKRLIEVGDHVDRQNILMIKVHKWQNPEDRQDQIQ